MIDDESLVTIKIEKDDQGRVKVWIEEAKDDAGILISRRVDTYSYYETCEVDIIIQQIFDGEGSLRSEKTVKHFMDGRKLEVTEVDNG